MKILTVIDTLKRGGRPRAAQDYALGYLRAGHGSAVLAVTGGGPRAQVLRQREVPVFIGGDDEAARAEAEGRVETLRKAMARGEERQRGLAEVLARSLQNATYSPATAAARGLLALGGQRQEERRLVCVESGDASDGLGVDRSVGDPRRLTPKTSPDGWERGRPTPPPFSHLDQRLTRRPWPLRAIRSDFDAIPGMRSLNVRSRGRQPRQRRRRR